MYPASQDRARQPIGHILVQGEIWEAVSREPIPANSAVRVTGFSQDILEAELVMQGPPIVT